ncbi:MAG: ComEC/Rec2 family competence protein [Hyphomicrobiales bacterium]|nr:MAG: ComEC/Rec2 family competence protein [Hyphomicrobiales bacterium]
MVETLETGRLAAGNAARPEGAAAAWTRASERDRRRGLAGSLIVALDERRLSILLPFGLILGLILSIQLPSEPNPAALGVGAVSLAVAGLLALRSLTCLRVVALLASVWAGLCLLPLHGALWGTAMLERPAYGEYRARVDEILSETAAQKRVILSEIAPLGTARALPIRRGRVVIEAGPDLSPGDVISGPFRFAPVPGPVYPGGFDTQFHAYFDGIGAYGNATRPPVIVSTGSETAPAHVIDAVRRGISARVDAELPQPSAGIARAIINGDQSAVTDEAREVMATAGIAHVLSVSGLHLTIVAGGVFGVLRLLLAGIEPVAARVPVKRVAAVAGIAAAVLYFAISGGNVAAFRSTLMILLVFGAVLFGRRALTMRNVAIAALVVIATDPASVFRPSFQLSFAAVVALVGAYENLRSERLKDANLLAHAWAYGKGVVITSLVAGGATVLFSIYHFQQTSPLGVVGNLLSLPLVGFVMMPAAALAVLLMPLGLEWPFLAAMGWSIDRMLEMAAIVAAWSEHLRASPLLTPWALVIGLGALAWFAFFRDRWRLLAPALAVPLVVLLAVDQPPDVLIADTTQAMVVRGPTGLELADGKAESFALNVWRETYASPIDIAAEQGCDSLACVGTSSAGFRYAIVANAGAFAEECGAVELVVTRLRAPSYCAAAAVVDADDLAARGVHWLKWNASTQKFEIRPAIGELNRPWRLTP